MWSAENQGSTFTLRLPEAGAARDRAPQYPDPDEVEEVDDVDDLDEVTHSSSPHHSSPHRSTQAPPRASSPDSTAYQTLSAPEVLP